MREGAEGLRWLYGPSQVAMALVLEGGGSSSDAARLVEAGLAERVVRSSVRPARVRRGVDFRASLRGERGAR